MKREPEVYELIKQLEYFYNVVLNVNINIERAEDKENPNPTDSTAKRFRVFKEQIDTHIADIIDELQTAKNGVMQ